MKTKYIGYWNNSRNEYPDFALPKPNQVLENQEAINIVSYFDLFLNKENYRGWSNCRICGEMNGCGEYHIQDKINDVLYVIPEGYKHYLKEHLIGPDLENLRKAKECLK